MTDPILASVSALSLPDSAALSTRATRALTFIESFEIASTEDYALAADELHSIKAKSRSLEDQRTNITGPINAALKAVNALFRGPADTLACAESMLKSKMLVWDQEQRRIAAEAQRVLDEAVAAERRRLEAEAQVLRLQVESAAAAATQAQASGDTAAAEQLHAEVQRKAAEAQAVSLSAAVITAPSVAAPAKVAGISSRQKLDFEVVDLHALVCHIAQHPDLVALLMVDSVKLRAYVRGLGAACALPGVKVSESSVLSARAA